MKTGRPPAAFYEMGGHQFTCRQLAELAGCSHQAMHRRLARGHSPAKAVAWGPADRNRKRPEAVGTPRQGKHEYNGQRYTCAQLAELAGCGWMAMRSRLRLMSPAEAVARGASDPHRKRKPDAPVKAQAPKPPKPAPVKQTKPASSAKLSAKSWSISEKKADKRTLKPADMPGEGIRTEKTVVTVAKHFDRFAVDPASVPSIFGRIGQYEDTGTAIARQYG